MPPAFHPGRFPRLAQRSQLPIFETARALAEAASHLHH